MKKLTLIALLTIATVCSAGAAEKDLPPGLQKKDKLPPGIAKKRGTADDERTRVVTNTVVVTNVVVASAPTVPTAPTAPVPAAKVPGTPTLRQLKVDIDKRARAINTLDNKEATRRAGLEAIANETGVSVPTLQVQHREHQNIGTAGLLMGNAIAAQTKRPTGNYLRQHEQGKSWERIAADQGVNIEELDAKLARVEQAMRSAK
jgi:hypothetical protein